ncbi:hypothetical protein [Pedobacter sp. SL55]|uniref:hypothetical protein n=1 Tax=Pedobacter sp. SL55 TaxID=2995161 RepID=UPI0022700CAA|nr:hypothetical protein [Pedobacter sp. SL55]WAC40250.1 hypothetical protein OVA16_16995 [Pedobacter sp. SL55]
MKRLILMFTVAMVAATLQSANAQVSLNINIGTQPRYGYFNDYYVRPVVHRTYYAPAPRVVYVKQNNFSSRRYYKPGKRVVSRNYVRPAAKHYVKKAHYKHYNKPAKHHRGNGRGRH